VNAEAPPTNCGACGRPLEQAPGGHRARYYCNATCRKAAWRGRASAWSWLEHNEPQIAAVPTKAPTGLPSPGKSTVNDVAETVCAAAAVCAELRRHGLAAPGLLAVKCYRVASALDAALDAEFGDLLR